MRAGPERLADAPVEEERALKRRIEIVAAV